MKKFSSLIKESKITVDDINDFFLDFVDDSYSISDLITFKKVCISSLYGKASEGEKICVVYNIDNRFYSIDDSKIDFFIKFLSSVKENCNRWDLDYKINLGHDRELIIFKDVPDVIKRYSRSRQFTTGGYMAWEGALILNFGEDSIKFSTLIKVDENFEFTIKLRSTGSSEWTTKQAIKRIVNNKESINVAKEHFKSHGLEGDVEMFYQGLVEGDYENILFTLKVNNE